MSTEPPPPPPPASKPSPFGRFQTVSVLAAGILAVAVGAAVLAGGGGGGGAQHAAPAASEYAQCTRALTQASACDILRGVGADSARSAWRSCTQAGTAAAVCLAAAEQASGAKSTAEYRECSRELATPDGCRILRGARSRAARAVWRSCMRQSQRPNVCLARARRVSTP